MKRTSILRALAPISVMVAAICLSAAGAQQAPNLSQQTDSGTPIQPLGPLPDGSAPSGAVGQSNAPVPGQTQPDTHVLSGVETLGLTSLRRLGHTFDPVLEASEFGETGIEAGKTVSATNFGGSLDTVHNWSRYNLTVTYNGAESIYHPSYYYGIHNLPYQK